MINILPEYIGFAYFLFILKDIDGVPCGARYPAKSCRECIGQGAREKCLGFCQWKEVTSTCELIERGIYP